MHPSADERVVYVQPFTRAYALFFCWFGVLVFAVTMFLWLTATALAPAAYGLLGLTSAALLLLGCAKLMEPPISIAITPTTITYLHRRGSWVIAWDNVMRYGVPQLHRGMGYDTLPYLGIRLRNIEPLLSTITPRLAVHLLREQRHLIVTALRYEKPDLGDYTPYFEVPDRYVAESGTIYYGVQAMFAKRCEHFRELLGYDLVLSATTLDRDLDAFISWLQKLERNRKPTLPIASEPKNE